MIYNFEQNTKGPPVANPVHRAQNGQGVCVGVFKKHGHGKPPCSPWPFSGNRTKSCSSATSATMPDSLLHTSFMDIIIQPPLNVKRLGTCWFDDINTYIYRVIVGSEVGWMTSNSHWTSLRSTPNILRIALGSVHHGPTKNNLPSPKKQMKQVNELLGALITGPLQHISHISSPRVYVCILQKLPWKSCYPVFCGENQLHIYQPLTRCHHLQNLWVVPRRTSWDSLEKTLVDLHQNKWWLKIEVTLTKRNWWIADNW